MKATKTLPILLLSLLPSLVFAGGGHNTGHDTNHNMAGMMNMTNSASGQPGKAADITRTIDITMNDNMRFTPSQFHVNAGETVRFFVKNAGRISHELVIGSAEALEEHAKMMRDMPGMDHVENNMLSLGPGQRGGLIWQFTQTGYVDFACLLPGHREAGMKGKIMVM
ncbi:Copper tolerance protein [Moritella sp. JT01]|uniref:cupredoxin domain-containing protein n=1 Tax=Moritella sp. JT01 TaxID=756698 RepID=UPI000799B883|nr:cupredoxin family protein [Moritella sp. JT01]KXO14367.1 Copper tolerance protein [Moritella sp. JT01]